jgi:predicted dithiol-disulfide oxidoreductase (DUF899 family)
VPQPEQLASGAVFHNHATEPMDMTDREQMSVFVRDGAGAVFHTSS